MMSCPKISQTAAILLKLRFCRTFLAIPLFYRLKPLLTNIMSTPTPVSLSYADAGVDMVAGDALVDAIKPFAKRTRREGVRAGIGGFGAFFEVSKNTKSQCWFLVQMV